MNVEVKAGEHVVGQLQFSYSIKPLCTQAEVERPLTPEIAE